MTQSQYRTDTELKSAIDDELAWTPSVNPANIGVSVNEGAVTLSGEVRSYPEKLEAEKAALRVRGVTGLAQEITVRTAYAAINDTDIAREASEAINRAIDIPEGAVKATVHDHIVTLSGSVAWNFERESAGRSVRYLKGVHDVFNRVTIKPTVSTANIKSAINAALVRSAALDAQHTTVTATPSGVVNLTGTVHTWAERYQAEQVAWAAPGVSSVVNKILIKN